MADLVFPGATPSGTLGSTRLPANYDLVIWQGDAQAFTLVLKDSSGNLIDLTGYTPAAEMRTDFASETLHSFDCAVASAGTVTVAMDSEVCKTIAPGSYVWSFQVTETATGNQRTFFAGDVTVYAEVPIV